MRVSTVDIANETSLISGPVELVRQSLWSLALAVAFTTTSAPLGKVAATLYVLRGLRALRPFLHVRVAFLFSSSFAPTLPMSGQVAMPTDGV
jgi:hypothetical protein